MIEAELLTFAAAEKLTGVSQRTLTRMVERGDLRVYWFGKTKRLSRQELLTPKTKPGESSLTET